MRKQSGGNQPERSNVRMFYVDADLAPGEIQSITTALVAAIRPTHVITRGGTPKRLAAPQELDGNGTGQAELELDEAAEIVEEHEDGAPAAKAPRTRRTYRKPVPVEMDMSGNGTPWEDFASEKNPDSHPNKYLVAAAWLHDHGSVQTISPDHVYTCYKSAGWTFDVSDPGWPFRQLKSDGLGTTERGNFSINHIGLSRVEKMKSSA